MGMRVVGIKQLKNKLSEYVKLAARGETVLVTDRDRVVAQLVPPSVARHSWESDGRLAALIRRGVLEPPLETSGDAPVARPDMRHDDLMALLDEVRED